jgi:hypothetical protein
MMPIDNVNKPMFELPIELENQINKLYIKGGEE